MDDVLSSLSRSGEQALGAIGAVLLFILIGFILLGIAYGLRAIFIRKPTAKTGE